MKPSVSARKTRFLEEKLWRLMLHMSVPGLLGMLMIATNSLVELVGLMGGSARISAYGSDYLEVFLLGTFFYVFGLSSNVLIRAEGNIGQAMKLAAAAVLADIVCSYLLIGYFGLGVKGGAWGSVLSMLLYCLLNLRYLLSGRSASGAGRFYFGVDNELSREVLSVGFSAFLMQGTNFIRQVILFKTIAHYATGAELACFGAIYRIYMFSVLPVFGLLQSLQPAVGISYGAGQFGRSVQAVQVYRLGGALLLLPVVASALLFPAQMLSLLLPGKAFNPQDLFHFRLVMLLLPFVSIGVSGIIFFQATGQARMAAMLSFGREALFIPLMLGASYWWGVPGVYYGLFIENLLYFFTVWLATRFAFGTASRPVIEKRMVSGA